MNLPQMFRSSTAYLLNTPFRRMSFLCAAIVAAYIEFCVFPFPQPPSYGIAFYVTFDPIAEVNVGSFTRDTEAVSGADENYFALSDACKLTVHKAREDADFQKLHAYRGFMLCNAAELPSNQWADSQAAFDQQVDKSIQYDKIERIKTVLLVVFAPFGAAMLFIAFALLAELLCLAAYRWISKGNLNP